MAAEAEEDDLSRAFRGGVTLTFREDATITLTPEQVCLSLPSRQFLALE